MANERQSRQQMSERAQTGSRSAQQGEWQPSTQRSSGQPSGGQMSGGQGGAYPAQRSSATAPDFFGGYGASPFSMMRRLSEEMDRIFENFGMGRGAFPSAFGGGGTSAYGGQEGLQSLWSPSIDVCEQEGKLCITADLPGLKKDDVTVQIDNDAVVIQGQRSDERSTDAQGYYQRERRFGSFYRAIPLPEGARAEEATATFRDGVLKIEMPAPQQQSRGRKLEIRDAGGGDGSEQGSSARTG